MYPLCEVQHGSKILMTFSDVGKKPPTFNDASEVANQIMNCGFDFERGSVYYNVYKSVVSYKTTTLPIHSMSAVTKAKNMGMYDSVDDELLRSYSEFQFASLIYYAMKEAATSEQSSRMTAMDGASKNAGEMIDKLTLTYNRTRQAVITRELIEIISGAAAV
ncbi:ATP synthase subunit gamma, mitochondrial [Lingula anatina]|uniref:F-ATPase gamma subunit n=1 Tax=Lingula anatina TaxID=7574 RepID=A0A1S3HDN9_LINAN|nr:ATP synthase subunit gamma, mitochondrial [Lingula anatina]|eukprot:XP_013384140.2 ATP synthase subunit gamma, mitochondrial [Lingula anatina]